MDCQKTVTCTNLNTSGEVVVVALVVRTAAGVGEVGGVQLELGDWDPVSSNTFPKSMTSFHYLKYFSSDNSNPKTQYRQSTSCI